MSVRQTGPPVARLRAVEAPPTGPEPAGTSAAAVLRHWDVRRARAWRRGDPVALRSLYVAGSAAGRRDRSMLRAWTRRGLRVGDLRMQLLAVQVRVGSARRLVLLVTDRLAGAVALGPGLREALPRDRAGTHRVELVLTAGEWRVVDVRQARPAARTASTSGS